LTTIIQCPSCQSRYRLKFDIADGQQVRCPNCQTIWRYQAESALEPVEAAPAPHAAAQAHAAAAAGSRFETQHAEAHSHHNAYAHQQHETETRQEQADWSPSAAAHTTSAPAQQENWNADTSDTHLNAFWQRGRQADEGGEAAAGSYAQEDAGSHAYASAEAGAEARQSASFGDFVPGGYTQDQAAPQADSPPAGANWASELAAAINRGGHTPDFNAAYNAAEANAGTESAQELQHTQGEPENTPGEPTGADFWRDSPVSRALGDSSEIRFGEIGPDGDWQPLSFDNSQNVRPRQRGGLALAAAWGIYLTVTGGLIAAVLLMRDPIVQAMPGAATVYSRIGMGQAGPSLGFEGVNYSWGQREGQPSLEVKGSVVNLTNSRITLPLLQITVRNSEDMEIGRGDRALGKKQLEPHEKLPFWLGLRSAPQSVAEIELQLEK
jgi:predicted Zn finger-like uncharacterized protein